MTLRWWSHPTPIGELGVTVGDAGVCRISLPGADPVPPPEAVEERVDAFARQLDEHFDGTRRTFDADLDLSGARTPFQREVLLALRREVPWGTTVTYGELAEIVGRPRAARAVGTTMASNPVPLVVPCHRVVASAGNGAVRLGGYGGADGRPEMKRVLLAIEGVQVPD